MKSLLRTWWILFLYAGLPLLGTVTLVYITTVRPKLEVCRVYYPEVSRMSCYFSHYGLPPRGR